MKQFALFQEIGDDELLAILIKMKPKMYEPGAQIVKNHDAADFLVIVTEGVVDIVVNGNKVVERPGPAILGENALKPKSFRTADMVAQGQVKAILLYRMHFQIALSDFEDKEQVSY